MVWKIFEFVIRLFYFRRFRAAKKIGEAGQLLTDGNPQKALALLEKTGASLHQSLLPIYAFTRGKILDALRREDEAQEAFRLVVLADPENARADLELAILCGKGFRFDECRQWLDRLREKDDAEAEEQANGIRALLAKVTSGERGMEFEKRAFQMAKKNIGENGAPPGFPPDLKILDWWISKDPDAARELFDEIALLVGQSEVAKGGSWKVSLSIDRSVIVYEHGSEISPFEIVADRFESNDLSLSELIEKRCRRTP